jgi:hypothetical protein
MVASEIRTVGLDDVVCLSPSQISRRLGEEVAILHMDKAAYYGLDPVGGRIWALIEKPVAVRKVLETMLGEYEVDAETAERDLLEIVGQLIDAGLVERRDATGP